MKQTILAALAIGLAVCLAISLWRKSATAPPVPHPNNLPNTVAAAHTGVVTAYAETAPPRRPLGATKTLPVAAADGMATNAPPAAPVEDKFQLLRDLRAWATRDPQAALAAALKLPAGDERNQGLEAVCFGLAQNDPADAVKLAQKLNLNANSDGAMQNLMQQWASADASSALTWTLAQPAGDERDALVDRVAFIMSQTDPSDAANVVINDMPPGSAQDQAVMSVLHQWALQDVIGAADWVATFPPGSLRDRALSELEDIEHYQQAMQAAH